MNSDFSDFIRFFPIFRLFPTSRLLDSTPLGCTPSHAADAAAVDGIAEYHRCIITKASVTSVHILVVALREGLRHSLG